MTFDETHANVRIESVSPTEYATRTVRVEFLYLDREQCTRCRETEDVLAEAIDRIATLLDSLDVELVVERVHVDSERAARQTGLAVSPTVRVNGHDVQPEYAVSTCESCGELCDCDGTIDCRAWTYRGAVHETPPVELFVEALLSGALSHRNASSVAGDTRHTIPENLRQFFGTETQQRDEQRDC